MWAWSLGGIWAISTLCICFCLSCLNYCSSPNVEGTTKSGLLQLSPGCPHYENVADLLIVPSLVFLTKFQGKNREFLLELLSPSEGDRETLLDLLSPCEEPRICHSHMNDGIDRRSVPLQDEDHLGNDPHLVPGFQRLCSGVFPERFPSASLSVASEETPLI